MADAIELKHYCEEIFSEYNITNFTIEKDEIVLRIKRKSDYDRIKKMINEFNKMINLIPQLSTI